MPKTKILLKILVPRNVIAVLASKRRAGSHTKPYKAVRGKLNREGYDD